MQNNRLLKIKKMWVSSEIDTHLYNCIDKGLILIIVTSILIFILWPITAVLRRSIVLDDTISIQLYREIFQSHSHLIYNSIFIATLTTIMTILVATAVALYTVYGSKFIKRMVFSLLLLTMISPPFVSSLAYITLFGRRGMITHKLLGLSINPYGWQGIVSMQTIGSISMASMIIIGVLLGINKNIIHASLDLGASPFETVRRVILPLAKPGIIAAAFICFVQSLSDFGTPIIIGGGYNVLATEAYLQIIGRGNVAMASAMSVVILLPAFLFFLLYRNNIKNLHFFHHSISTTLDSGDIDFQLNKGFRFLVGGITWTFIIFMLLQYSAIVLEGISNYSGGEIRFTFQHIKNMRVGRMASFMRSIRYAFIASCFTSIIGVLLAYYIERRKIPGRKALDFMATLPNIIPGTFFGIGYILAFNNEPLLLTGTASIVVLNCIFRQIPIATKSSAAVLHNINPELENAAKDLGVHNLFIIKDVIIPLLKPAILISFINTFVATMTTVGAIIFIISPASKVATVEMFSAIRDGDYGQGAVLACMIIFVSLIINLLLTKLLMNKEKI